MLIPKNPLQCQAVLTFAIQLHAVFCVVAFSQRSVSSQAAEHPLTDADSIWLHLLQAIFMLFISTARYKISDYCNILPESPYGKKYKQSEGHEKRREKKKTTGHAALLWLLFSVQSGKREQRAALPLTMALQWIQIIKILVQNLASTCKGEHQMYQKFDKMVSGLCLVTINLSTSYLLKQGLSGYTERTKRLHQLSRK